MGVLKVKVISLPYIFKVLYVLCFSRPRYQVSVHRTIGPLVSNSCRKAVLLCVSCAEAGYLIWSVSESCVFNLKAVEKLRILFY